MELIPFLILLQYFLTVTLCSTLQLSRTLLVIAILTNLPATFLSALNLRFVFYFFKRQTHGIRNVKKYNDARKNNTLIWVSNDTTVNQQALYKNATYDFNEIVKRIYVRYIAVDKDGKIGTEIALDGKSTSIKEQRHRGLRRCYTFQLKKEI